MNQELLNRWTGIACQNPPKIAFPEATEEKILQAAMEAAGKGAIIPVFVGKADDIKSAALKHHIELTGAEFAENTEDNLAAAAEEFTSGNPFFSVKSIVRRGKDPMVYAFVLQAIGQVDGVFAGLTHTTGEVILAAQTYVGLKSGITTASSIGIMDIPGYEGIEGNLLAFGDSAVCTQPSAEELADIAVSACDTVMELLGWTPRCAMLSFSTDGSAEHALAQKVRDAVKIAHVKRPELFIDGEFQLDAALLPEIASKKVKRESEVAGKANIIIYPDLSAGNIGVKLMQTFAHCDAYGPMLQGFARPVSDCSRSAPVSELVGNIIMLAVRAQKGRKVE